MTRKFFINSNKLNTLHILDNFLNILPKKYSLLSIKEHRYYTCLVKRYRLLGLLHSQRIKLNIVNKKTNDSIY